VHWVLALISAVLGLGASAVDFRPSVQHDHISAIELAERIVSRDTKLQIFDLRSRSEYEELHIPTAKYTTIDEVAREPIPRDSTIVLYSEGRAPSAQISEVLRTRGYRNVFFLREGIYEWISRVREPRLAVDATTAERDEFQRAAELSRFFGGVPISGVPRSEVPTGYWTGAAHHRPASTQQAVTKIRRRGC
jgi:rhodanese-related sulfurtransferase